MTYSLRPYQSQMLEDTRACIRAGIRRVLVVLATGGGKTVIASHMIQGAVQRSLRCVFMAHRKELIDQCSRKLDENGIPHGIIKAGHWRVNNEPVQVPSCRRWCADLICRRPIS